MSTKNRYLTIISLLMFGSFMLLVANDNKFENYKVASTESTQEPKISDYSIVLQEMNSSGVSGVAILKNENQTVALNLTDQLNNYKLSLNEGICGENNELIQELSEVKIGFSETRLKKPILTSQISNISVYSFVNGSKSLVSCGILPQ